MATSDSLRQVPDELLAQQRRALLSGERPSIAELLAGTPYGDDREACLDLLYNEVVVLEELGEQVTPEAYIARYPHLREDIEVHFEIHRAVHGPLVMDTLGSQDATDWGAGERLQRNALLPVADYEIHELLGHGAMSDVFRARDRELHRPVALKVFRYGTLLTERHAARIRTEAAAMGDDWPDLSVMTRCAFAVAPANAHTEVRARAHWVTPSCGGHGAVRECCDLLLTATGHYARLLDEALDP